jgi:hypothetical protein
MPKFDGIEVYYVMYFSKKIEIRKSGTNYLLRDIRYVITCANANID